MACIVHEAGRLCCLSLTCGVDVRLPASFLSHRRCTVCCAVRHCALSLSLSLSLSRRAVSVMGHTSRPLPRLGNRPHRPPSSRALITVDGSMRQPTTQLVRARAHLLPQPFNGLHLPSTRCSTLTVRPELSSILVSTSAGACRRGVRVVAGPVRGAPASRHAQPFGGLPRVWCRWEQEGRKRKQSVSTMIRR